MQPAYLPLAHHLPGKPVGFGGPPLGAGLIDDPVTPTGADQPASLLVMAPGAFLVLGFLMAIFNRLKAKGKQ